MDIRTQLYVTKIFDNDLVTSKSNKPVYVGMCMLDLSNVFIHEFHYDYIKNKCGNNSRLLFTDTGSLMYEIKTEDVHEGFSKDKIMFYFSSHSAKSKHCHNSNNLIVSKMKDETGGVIIEDFVEVKTKMYSFLIDDSSEHEKAKGVNKDFVAATCHSEYKDLLFNNKCFRYSMNRIQSKNHKIGTYKIKRYSLSCFDDKISTLNNGYDGLVFGYYK